ncbi:MAG: hypothetical protein AAFR99_11500 [Cyanobacteria bacterium J06629_9]
MDANFPTNHPQSTDPADPMDAPRHPGERPAILHTITLDNDPDDQRLASLAGRPEWVTFAIRRWQWLCLGGIAFVALLATAALVNTKAENLQGSQTPTQPDQDALLALSTAEFDSLDAQVNLQLDATYERLIDLEATRFLQEAEKQTLDASQPCYRLGTECVLDQFETDAVVHYADGSATLNRQQQLEALLRIAIVDRARTGLRLAPTPDDALTTMAIQKRLEARQMNRAATAEGMAKDVQQRKWGE